MTTEQTPATPMLRPFELLRRCTVTGVDGDVGQVEDAYFDDASWTVRHLVVDTGRWLPGRRVLVSPRVVSSVDGLGEQIRTHLRRQQIQDAPGVDAARPMGRQKEAELARYYGHADYWAGPYRWGLSPYPFATLSPPPRPSEMAARDAQARTGDPTLRSVREVEGYGIAATDGELGHVEDVLVDDASWAIRYFVVDPRSWWPGPHVMLPTEWLTDISWSDRVVRVDVTREAVRGAPHYLPPDEAPPLDVAQRGISREYERRVYGHYGRSGYWDRDPGLWLIRPAA
jgi:hypothetical protein